jgi:TRAP-type transport system periplasmic protein
MNAKSVVFNIAIAAAACGVAFAEQPQTRVKLATLAPRGSSIHQILQAMGEKWRDAPGGGAALTIYTDGTMGGEAEAVRRMRVNQVQAGMLSVAGLAQIDRAVTALQFMPMVFRSTSEVEYVRHRLRPMLDKRMEEKGFVALFWADAGWVRFFSKKPVIRPDDLKKLKMFALSSDVNQIDLMKSVGFQPVPLEYTDTLTGLQTGLIESVPTIPFYALAGQLYLPASYMLEINYVPLTGGLVVSRNAWEALPPMTRAVMRQAAEEAGAKIQEQSRKEMHESVAAMKKRGLKVDQVTPEVEAEWRALFEAVYPKLRGNLVPADMYDEVQRLLKEYRK